jgi:hypothetical protein
MTLTRDAGPYAEHIHRSHETDCDNLTYRRVPVDEPYQAAQDATGSTSNSQDGQQRILVARCSLCSSPVVGVVSSAYYEAEHIDITKLPGLAPPFDIHWVNVSSMGCDRSQQHCERC